MSNSTQKNTPSFYHPKYWPTWCLIGLIKFIGGRSFRAQMKLGRLLGAISYRIAKRRRSIAETNINLCFPELDHEARKQLVKQSITENLTGLVETMRAWCGSSSVMDGRTTIEGAENLLNAMALGRGVLLVGAHYTAIDLGCVMTKSLAPFVAAYSPNKNALMDRFICEGRLKNLAGIIDRRDMRGMVRSLRNGEILWYAPDQDYGLKHSVFAPFFGVPAATLRMTAKMAAMHNSPVVIISIHREPDNEHYRVRFRPPLENYPTGDEVSDATTINQALEKEIRLSPAQYMWVHRRFKSRPSGEESFYKGL